jgi:hypothetical protein
MSVGAIGSTIFTNQMTTVASAANGHNNREDFQNMVAQAAINEKDEKVLEVRPAEENQKVNEDREQTRDEADRENKRNPKKEDDEEERESESIYKLDIKV